ncbi:hypothetical protein ABW17_30120 [Mycobacterium nebraskense]|nr:hypothetical protein ABW17_30120 [Mycobacterium nebraskense]
MDDEHAAQIEAFEDTWRWTPATDIQFGEFIESAPMEAGDALTAFHTLLGENDAMAFLTNMASRLLELHRVLKPTSSIYLHCDPTMTATVGPGGRVVEAFVDHVALVENPAYTGTEVLSV